MVDNTQVTTRSPDDIAGRVPEVIKARQELIEAETKRIQKVGIEPYSVPQSTFPETMKQGVHGMINRMVDYNAVTRSVEAPASGIGCGLAVSQSTAYDINCVLGGDAARFIGITILDPTNIIPIGSTVPVDSTPQYMNIGIITKGEIFITTAAVTLAGDPVYFVAATGVLSNVNTGVLIAGARWKYARPSNELNAVQLGIQR